MAGYNVHEKKYITNKKILSENIFDEENDDYNDWAITVAFYASLHLIEMKLHHLNLDTCMRGKRINHKNTTKLMYRNRAFDSIVEDYQDLLDLSWEARYTAKCKKKKVIAAYECLSNIEKQLKDIVPSA
ncbi:MAG: hypothetical protein E6590_17415 [Clostridiales bacterium]|nr:hypothetical protein [Clostridiales bacterium]